MKREIVQVRELSSPDETFHFGRRQAGVHKKTVHIVRQQGNKVVPIMEFEPTGQYSEINAPALKVNLMERMLSKIESLPLNKQTTKKIYQYAGVELMLPEVKK